MKTAAWKAMTPAPYRDSYDHLAECFDLIRLRADAYNIRNEALDSERLVRYSERLGIQSERSQFLEIYSDLERQVAAKEEEIRARKREAESQGVRFPLDRFASTHGLSEEELWVSVLLLWNEAQGTREARFISGNEILNVLFPRPADALKASRVFLPGGALTKRGILRPRKDAESANFLRCTWELCDEALLELLGGTRPAREEESETLATREAPEGPFRVVQPRFGLERVALPASVRRLLAESVEEARARSLIWREWGLDEVLEKGKGVVLLFAGPPGTGKSMAAEGLAGELDMPLLVADYAELESKWIGETEKNIVSAFRAAREAHAVLLFDEADSVLAHRLSGDHYNDRAYNRQVALFLSEIERHEGVVILTSNRKESLDSGLARRIGVKVAFPRPGEEERFSIWKSLMPPRAPLAAEVDLRALAREFPLSGGDIKNAVLGALRKTATRRLASDGPRGAAAADGGETGVAGVPGVALAVTQADLIEAAIEASQDLESTARPIGFQASFASA